MKTFFSLLIASLAFFSCNKKNDQPADQPQAGTNVYVSGFVNRPSNGSLPCYWKNGTRVDLEIPAGYGSASKIAAAANGDIYIIGTYTDNGNFKSCYWKNGKRTDIEPLPGHASTSVSDICISGTDIYIAGLSYNAYPPYSLCYWKNGTPVQIKDVIDPMQYSFISSIAVSGSEVCLSGYCGQAGGIETACVWKNAVRTNLDFGGTGKRSMAAALRFNATSLFAGGYAYNDANTVKTATYWIGANYFSVGPGNGHSEIKDIDVTGIGVYSAGSFTNNYKLQSPCYWENQVLIPLPGLNKDAGYANGIQVSGGDNFISGTIYNSIAVLQPALWKNKSLTQLSVLDSTKGGYALDVYVGK